MKKQSQKKTDNIQYQVYKILSRLAGKYWFSEKKLIPAKKEDKENLLAVFDIDFVTKKLNISLDKKLEDFKKITNIEQRIVKKGLGRNHYSAVISYQVEYLSKDNSKNQTEIYLSANTDGSRKQSYEMAKLLWNINFSSDKYKIIKPIAFWPKQNCFVYFAAPGLNLYHFLLENNKDLDNLIKLSAGWIKQLHQTNLSNNLFPLPTLKINKMIPRPSFASYRLKKTFPKWGDRFEDTLLKVIEMEKAVLKSKKLTIIYGDYHPENIIFASNKINQVKLIDFTDMGLGHPYRDLGTFIQQLAFMSRMHTPKQKVYKLKKIFLETYFEKKYKDIDQVIFDTINLYQAWTALRSAIFIFFSRGSQRLIFELIHDAERYLEKIAKQEKTVNIK